MQLNALNWKKVFPRLMDPTAGKVEKSKRRNMNALVTIRDN